MESAAVWHLACVGKRRVKLTREGTTGSPTPPIRADTRGALIRFRLLTVFGYGEFRAQFPFAKLSAVSNDAMRANNSASYNVC